MNLVEEILAILDMTPEQIRAWDAEKIREQIKRDRKARLKVVK